MLVLWKRICCNVTKQFNKNVNLSCVEESNTFDRKKISQDGICNSDGVLWNVRSNHLQGFFDLERLSTG